MAGLSATAPARLGSKAFRAALAASTTTAAPAIDFNLAASTATWGNADTMDDPNNSWGQGKPCKAAMRVYTKGHEADEIARAFSRLHPWSRVKHLDTLCRRFNRTPIQLEAVANCTELTEHLHKMYANDPTLLLIEAAKRAARRAAKRATEAQDAVAGAIAVRAAREAYRATLAPRSFAGAEEEDVVEAPAIVAPTKKLYAAGSKPTPTVDPVVAQRAAAAAAAAADAKRLQAERVAAEKKRSRDALRKVRAEEQAKLDKAALAIQGAARRRNAVRARKKRQRLKAKHDEEQIAKQAKLEAKHAKAKAKREEQAELERAAASIQRRARYRNKKKTSAREREEAAQAKSARAIQKRQRRRATKRRTRQRLENETKEQSSAALKIQRRSRKRSGKGAAQRREVVRAALVSNSIFTRKFRERLSSACQRRLAHVGNGRHTQHVANVAPNGGILTAVLYKAYLTPMLNTCTDLCMHELEHIAADALETVVLATAFRYRERLDRDVALWLKFVTKHRTTVFLQTQALAKRVSEARSACFRHRSKQEESTGAMRTLLRANGAVIAAVRTSIEETTAEALSSFRAAVAASATASSAAPARILKRLQAAEVFQATRSGALSSRATRLLRRVLTPSTLAELQRVRAQLHTAQTGLKQLEAAQRALAKKIAAELDASRPAMEALQSALAQAEVALAAAREGEIGAAELEEHEGGVIDKLARMYHTHRFVPKTKKKAAATPTTTQKVKGKRNVLPFETLSEADADVCRDDARMAVHELATKASALGGDARSTAVVKALCSAAAVKGIDLTEMFSMIDVNGNGNLSFSEWRTGCRACGCSHYIVSDSQLKHVFETIDCNGTLSERLDGSISLFEFLHFVRSNSTRIGPVSFGRGNAKRFARPTARVRIPSVVSAKDMEDIAFNAVSNVIAFTGVDDGEAAMGETMRGLTRSLEQIVWAQNTLAIAPKKAALKAAVLSGKLAAKTKTATDAAAAKKPSILNVVVAAATATAAETFTLVIKGSGLLGLSLGIDPQTLATVVTSINHDGVVEREFPGAVHPGDALVQVGDITLWTFGEWDANHDGRIDFDELRAGMLRLVPGTASGVVTDPELRRMMQRFDLDHDGTIDPDEFRALLTEYLLKQITAQGGSNRARPLSIVFRHSGRTILQRGETHGRKMIAKWASKTNTASAAKTTAKREKNSATVSPEGSASSSPPGTSKWKKAKIAVARQHVKVVAWWRRKRQRGTPVQPGTTAAVAAFGGVPAVTTTTTATPPPKASGSTSARRTPTSAADRAKCRKLEEAVRAHLPTRRGQKAGKVSDALDGIFDKHKGAKIDKHVFIEGIRVAGVPPEALSDWHLARIFRAACVKVNGSDDASDLVQPKLRVRFIDRHAH